MTPRVLVVDFDEASLSATTEMLRACGLDVLPAASLDQLERLLTTTAPQVALVEPALGTTDSHDLCSLIQRASSSDPRLILASKAMRGEALRFRAGEVGAELYFERPIDDQGLVEAIVEAVKGPTRPEPAADSIAARAIANLEREPANTSLELTDVDNSTFEGWIDDVFSEIEDGPAEVEAAPEPEPAQPQQRLKSAAETVFARAPEPQVESDFLGAPLDGEGDDTAMSELEAAAAALAPLEAATEFAAEQEPAEPTPQPTPIVRVEPVAPEVMAAPTPQPAAPQPGAPSVQGTIPLARRVAPEPRKPDARPLRPAPRAQGSTRQSAPTSAAAPEASFTPPPQPVTRFIFPVAAVVVLVGGVWWGLQLRPDAAGRPDEAARPGAESSVAPRSLPEATPEPTPTAMPDVSPEPTAVGNPIAPPTNVSTEPAAQAPIVVTEAATLPAEEAPLRRPAPEPEPAEIFPSPVVAPKKAEPVPEPSPGPAAPAIDLRHTLGLSADAEGRSAPRVKSEPAPAPIEQAVVERVAPIVPPRILPDSRVQPRMTPIAQRMGIGGLVVLRALVLRDGSVGEIEILEEPPRSGLGKAAASAVERWRYEPASQAGQPVETSVKVEIRFEAN